MDCDCVPDRFACTAYYWDEPDGERECGWAGTVDEATVSTADDFDLACPRCGADAFSLSGICSAHRAVPAATTET